MIEQRKMRLAAGERVMLQSNARAFVGNRSGRDRLTVRSALLMHRHCGGQDSANHIARKGG
jgi:hypothetical protein